MYRDNDGNLTDLGLAYYWDAIVELMDHDIREQVHMAKAPCSLREFFDEYCVAHEEKFCKPFVFN